MMQKKREVTKKIPRSLEKVKKVTQTNFWMENKLQALQKQQKISKKIQKNSKIFGWKKR